MHCHWWKDLLNLCFCQGSDIEHLYAHLASEILRHVFLSWEFILSSHILQPAAIASAAEAETAAQPVIADPTTGLPSVFSTPLPSDEKLDGPQTSDFVDEPQPVQFVGHPRTPSALPLEEHWR